MCSMRKDCAADERETEILPCVRRKKETGSITAADRGTKKGDGGTESGEATGKGGDAAGKKDAFMRALWKGNSANRRELAEILSGVRGGS